MKTKNTKGASQSELLLTYLSIHKTVTTTHCRDKLSIMHPGGRVNELRRKGWPIKTSYYQQTDASGRAHRAGEYYLLEDKLTAAQKLISAWMILRYRN